MCFVALATLQASQGRDRLPAYLVDVARAYICVLPVPTNGSSLGHLKGAIVSSKRTNKDLRRTRGGCGEERKRIVFDGGSLICPPGKSIIFYIRGGEKKMRIFTSNGFNSLP